MTYYSYEDIDKMPEKYMAILDKYIPTQSGKGFRWAGANIIVSTDISGERTPEVIEICKMTKEGKTEHWEHYCHIQRLDDTKTKTVTWEVNSQFNGENEDEMWVFATFQKFGNACRFIMAHDIKALKPVKIY